MAVTGLTERELGQVAVAQRAFARLNPNAVQRAPLSTEDYLAGRFICEPLRINDYCLVNDGGVALVVTTAERARRLDRPAVLCAVSVAATTTGEATSLRPRLEDFYRPAQRQAAEQVYAMAGIGPADVDVLQVYDSFCVHVPDGAGGLRLLRRRRGGQAPRLGRHRPWRPAPGQHLRRAPVRQLHAGLGTTRPSASARCAATRERGRCRTSRIGQYVSDVAGKATSIVYARADA